jgi:hypothetical protein
MAPPTSRTTTVSAGKLLLFFFAVLGLKEKV